MHLTNAPARRLRARAPFALVALVALAAACSDGGPTAPAVTPPAPVPPSTIAAVECTASVREGRMSCGPSLPAGVHADRIFGGQGTNVQLTSTNVAYDSVTHVFAADVTVQNLLVQRLGTNTGADTAGIKVFFSGSPAATTGSGAVSVKNADGADIFTGVDQPYFWYRQILPYRGVSSVKRWQWLMPPTVGSFSFKVYVSTPILPVVVFDRMVAGNLDIYRVALDGSDTVRLSTSKSDDQHPTSARSKVVFMTYRDTAAELYSVPLAGGAETRLTHSATTESDPALSPDGTKIAYISDAGGVGKLWTMNADGTGAARATASFSFSGSVEVAPSWFSSTRLAFVSTDQGTGDIYDLTLGGAPSLIIGGPYADLQPAVSPDGTRVAFVSNRNGDTELYLYTVATHVVTRLTTHTGTDAQPSWLPDGRLVYAEFTSGTPHLAWMDPAVPGVSHLIPTGPGAAQRPSGALF
jgi:hypothetical protein